MRDWRCTLIEVYLIKVPLEIHMKKERIESLKFMRVVAMMLVVLIHTTDVGITTLDATSPFFTPCIYC